MYIYIYIYIYIASKRQISRLVSTYDRFQGNFFEIVEIVKITN